MLISTDNADNKQPVSPALLTDSADVAKFLDDSELAPKKFDQLLEENAREQLKRCGEQLDALPARYEQGLITRDAYEKMDRYLTMQAEVWRCQLGALGFPQPDQPR